MDKTSLIATTKLGYGEKKLTREERFAKDKKFTDKIAATPKMDDKNFMDILNADFEWYIKEKGKQESILAAYKEGKLRSKRLIKEAKEMLKKGRKRSLALS